MVFPVVVINLLLLFIYYNYFLVTEMSKQSGIKSFFKVKTANEIEVEELLLTQISGASRATTLETTKSISTIWTKIISLIDLCNDTNNIESLVDYDSDSVIIDDDDMVGRMNQPSFNDPGSDSVEYVGVINSSIGG